MIRSSLSTETFRRTTDVPSHGMDDETHVKRAIELARESVDSGNNPFGALLVVDGEVVRTEENIVRTDADITGHPELKLARWAARELDDDEFDDCTMYTSTEPCPMCASAIAYSGLGRVVFSSPLSAVWEARGSGGIDIPCREVFDRTEGCSTTVEGPVLEDEGNEVHREFW